MNRFSFIAIASVVLSACGLQEQQKSSLNIVGGQVVTSDQAIYKSTASVTLTSGGSVTLNEPISFCTGTLLANKQVVTAASCFREDIIDLMNRGAKLNVVWGSNGLSVLPENSRVVSSYVNHTEFRPDEMTKQNPTAPANDIALVNFEGDVPAGFSAATLISPQDVYKPSEAVWIAGYGSTRRDSQETGTLRAAYSKYHSQNAPMKIIHFMSQDIAACHGDSGSPAFVSRNGVWVLAGLTSASNCRNYMRYTDVRGYQGNFLP